jgi:hypothetical protein
MQIACYQIACYKKICAGCEMYCIVCAALHIGIRMMFLTDSMIQTYDLDDCITTHQGFNKSSGKQDIYPPPIDASKLKCVPC